MPKAHAGLIVEKGVRWHYSSIYTISRKMSIDRRTIYNWLKKEDLSLKIIGQIEQISNYDFSADFQDRGSVKDIYT